jgi:hypothetical protein
VRAGKFKGDLAGETGDFAGFVGELKGENSDYTV